jgi:hypothetical protein
MVNTFLVDSDYAKSAEQLDSRRLGKQRVEAYQILNLIENIKILSIQSGIIYGSSSLVVSSKKTQISNFQSFVSQLKKWYNSQSFVYILTDKYDSSSKLIQSVEKKPEIPAEQRVIKMGFCNHPAVEMWYGYEDALKEYIDAHIREWIHRGYKNTMKIYDVKAKNHPQWCGWAKIHENHKGALLLKELDRKEKPWYQYKEDFLKVKKFEDYIWVKLEPQSINQESLVTKNNK